MRRVDSSVRSNLIQRPHALPARERCSFPSFKPSIATNACTAKFDEGVKCRANHPRTGEGSGRARHTVSTARRAFPSVSLARGNVAHLPLTRGCRLARERDEMPSKSWGSYDLADGIGCRCIGTAQCLGIKYLVLVGYGIEYLVLVGYEGGTEVTSRIHHPP